MKTTLLALLVVGVAAVTLLTGAFELTPAQVLAALTGHGPSADRLVVVGFRLPRLLAALLVGTALGVAGAVFQSVSRNPLGSPDIVGFTTGSATGALVAIVVGTGGAGAILGGSLVGGAIAATIVLLCATATGLGGSRFLLVGIAVGACLAAVNDYLTTRATLEQAQQASLWLFGTLNGVGWAPVRGIAIALVVAAVPLLLSRRWLRILELGDDSAAALGLDPTRARVVLLGLGVVLTASAIAVAGPIGFVALAAPQLAQRAFGRPATAIFWAGAVGALLLETSDLLAARLLSPFQIPVGLVTGALGGAYLFWFVLRANRRAVA